MNSNDVEQTVDNTLSYAENSVKYKLVSIQNILAIIFSILLLLAIIVCTICDITVAGKFYLVIVSYQFNNFCMVNIHTHYQIREGRTPRFSDNAQHFYYTFFICDGQNYWRYLYNSNRYYNINFLNYLSVVCLLDF